MEEYAYLSEQASGDDLKASLERFVNDIYTDADLVALRRALQTGQIVLVTGERAIAAGGGITDAVIITGDGNAVYVLKEADAETIEQIFHQTPTDLSKQEQRYLEQVRQECSKPVL